MSKACAYFLTQEYNPSFIIIIIIIVIIIIIELDSMHWLIQQMKWWAGQCSTDAEPAKCYWLPGRGKKNKNNNNCKQK